MNEQPIVAIGRARARISSILLLLASASCDAGDVGEPCLPDAEYSAQFAPFSVREVYLESSSFACATRICLVNHFQGRVSCPQGQSRDDPARVCHVPGSAGGEDDVVEGDVPAWDLDRSAERAVYCSCRCDGPDPNARYCECPSGFVCEKLAPDLGGIAKRELSGSYCIKSGSAFDLAQAGGPTCREAPEDARCVAAE